MVIYKKSQLRMSITVANSLHMTEYQTPMTELEESLKMICGTGLSRMDSCYKIIYHKLCFVAHTIDSLFKTGVHSLLWPHVRDKCLFNSNVLLNCGYYRN